MEKNNHIITEKDVRYVAGLARIHLDDVEIEPITQTLEKILEYITKLEQLDVSNVLPTSHVLPLKNVFREDKVEPLLTQDEALSIAVEKKSGYFKVPKVIE